MSLPEFQIFVKPVSAACNLACEYCYYLEKSGLFSSADSKLMSDDILEKYIIQHIEASQSDIISFSWHGGEPLLAGIDFYRKAVDIQKRNCPNNKKILNGLQTNGTLINEEWCRFLAAENFTVGISMDGPEEIHNRYRLTKGSGSTFSKVLSGYDQLVIHGIDPEILCVVNAFNVNHPLEVYSFFKDLGTTYITFIPLVERQHTVPETVSQRTVNALSFGKFLCAVFDEWVRNDIGKIKVQIFEETFRTAFNQDHSLCIFKETCGMVPVVERNGDFYSCDHFVQAEYHLGNIENTSINELLESKAQRIFGQNKKSRLPKYCLTCEVRQMCNGECPKNRFITTPDGDEGLNYLCDGYKKFFNHCRPFVESIRTAWQKQNNV